MTAYLILFGSAFGAATFLPFYSEVVLLAYLAGGYSPWGLWAVATAGNTLGAVVNWWLGRELQRFKGRRWFPVSAEKLELAQQRFQRWGQWSLLMAWAPIGGDALTFIGGIMRVRILPFLLLVGAGKGARYAVLILGAQQVGAHAL